MRCRLVTVRAAPAATQAVRLPKWEDMWGYLARERGLRSIPPEQAAEMVASGDYVLVDVRLPAQYATAHPAGAVSVPMYQTIVSVRPRPGPAGVEHVVGRARHAGRACMPAGAPTNRRRRRPPPPPAPAAHNTHPPRAGRRT
jgi:hypothetical protein